ncbi:MAG: uroporphyrinogen-III synthase [Candidatus Omnitrophica bacterium]|nr:uroporphyrinogen-III synthase [Candidatus Omnitrophota bacterium]
MSQELKLKGLQVVYFESRLSKTLGDLLRLQGAEAVAAPALKEAPIEKNEAAFSFAEALFEKKIRTVIFLTGVGTRYLVKILETRYSRPEIIGALKAVAVVPRGPKPVRALAELGVPYAVTVPEPNTWQEILKTLDQNPQVPVRGALVAVQEYGERNEPLTEGLRGRGAQVLSVPVYRWELPDDLGPLKNAIERIARGETDVVVFTTAVQADHLFKVADRMGVSEKLKAALGRLVAASVGPDCSEAIRSHGVEVDIEPESPKMGPLVKAVAEKAKNILERKKK